MTLIYRSTVNHKINAMIFHKTVASPFLLHEHWIQYIELLKNAYTRCAELDIAKAVINHREGKLVYEDNEERYELSVTLKKNAYFIAVAFNFPLEISNLCNDVSICIITFRIIHKQLPFIIIIFFYIIEIEN